MSEAVTLALIGGAISLGVAIAPKVLDHIYGTGKTIDRMSKDIADLKGTSDINSTMIYNMLDHMSTNNNTGGMKKCLDEYNAYFRK